MKIQCDICEKRPASMMCCADEAALCAECDADVHGANKLVGKHQRVALNSLIEPPKCDVCQEKSAFFFCTNERSLLCRYCDVDIHTRSALKASHNRYLITGTKVALEALSSKDEGATTPPPLNAQEMGQQRNPMALSNLHPNNNLRGPMGVTPSTISSISVPDAMTKANWVMGGNNGHAPTTPPLSTPNVPLGHTGSGAPPMVTMPAAAVAARAPDGGGGNGGGGGTQGPGGGSTLGSVANFQAFLEETFNEPIGDLLGIPGMAGGYSFGDVACPKADNEGLVGDFEWGSADFMTYGQLISPFDSFHEVPSMSPSPPTVPTGYMGGRVGRGSAPMKGKGLQDSIVPDFDDAFVVPDLGLHSAPASPPVAKRRRF